MLQNGTYIYNLPFHVYHQFEKQVYLIINDELKMISLTVLILINYLNFYAKRLLNSYIENKRRLQDTAEIRFHISGTNQQMMTDLIHEIWLYVKLNNTLNIISLI